MSVSRPTVADLRLMPYFDQPPGPYFEHTVLLVLQIGRQAIFTAYMLRGMGYEAAGCIDDIDAARLIVSARPQLLIVGAELIDGCGRAFAYGAQLSIPESKIVIIEDGRSKYEPCRDSEYDVWPLSAIYSVPDLVNRISREIGPSAPNYSFKNQRWWQFAEKLRDTPDAILQLHF